MSSRRLLQNRPVESIALLLILAVAFVLRIYQLDGSSLWSDEGNSWALLSRSFAQIARDAAADIHPPGYYWLLKVWTMLFGTTASGMRSFSAILGVLLVYLVYQIGVRLPAPGARRQRHWAALLAALLTALNPFQIYYSQEARMYMLLTVAGAGLVWSLLCYLQALPDRSSSSPEERSPDARLSDARLSLGSYVGFGLLGLWTHYSFPMLLLSTGSGYAILLLLKSATLRQQSRQRFRVHLYHFGRFILANLVILLGFLPWLPTAVRRLLAWPAGGETPTLGAGIQITQQIFLLGPLDRTLPPLWLWTAISLALPLFGALRLYQQANRSKRNGDPTTNQITATVVILWWLLPIALLFGAGLFTAAFLKFLLAASPAWLLLIAYSCMGSRRLVVWPAMLLITAGALVLAGHALPQYYTSPTVRDNYAGVAEYLQTVADPAQDLVLLNAPGQREVWAYYDPGIPVVALPKQRPPDPQATLATLQRVTADRQKVYALLWATDEADPARLVETWLDQHAFKGLESWQGNLRFVEYTFAPPMACTTQQPAIVWAASIQLDGYCTPTAEPVVAAGEVALVGLQWQATRTLAARYKVTVQLLDEQNQLIAQRDGEPVGGSRPTTGWQPTEVIRDNHGLMIPVGTPPGHYQLIIALYDPSDGSRLAVDGNDFFSLGTITVTLPTTPLPAALIPMQYRLHQPVGPVTLLGYNAHKQGMTHAPETPLVPGDWVTFTFIWQAPEPLPVTWPSNLQATLAVGEQQVNFPLAGNSYPTAAWQAAQIVQQSVAIPFDGSSRRAWLTIGEQSTELASLPVP